ncbi:MAG: phosphoribosylanthranilate isomerase [Chitinophagia bacterium]|nr:phosphoribosylanthranilate isomerase [Chitinophagia bacterium]
MRMKVCGMTGIDQVRRLDAMGVEFAGFIFYPRSPRFVGKFDLDPEALRRERLQVNRVGVFVDAPLDELLRAVDTWRLHMVQLHGDESPRYCEKVSSHVTTVKAFRVAPDDDLGWKTHSYREAVDMYLFDSVGVSYGGNGTRFDWKAVEGRTFGKPWFLSGGIGPEDAGAVAEVAAARKELFAIDVNSRFESSPGVKDMASLEAFRKRLTAGSPVK